MNNNYTRWFTDITDNQNNLPFEDIAGNFNKAELKWLSDHLNREGIHGSGMTFFNNDTTNYRGITAPARGWPSRAMPPYPREGSPELIKSAVEMGCQEVACHLIWNPENEFLERNINIQITKYQDDWFVVEIQSFHKITLGDGIKINKNIKISAFTKLLGPGEVTLSCDGFAAVKKLLTLLHIEDDDNNKKYSITKDEQ